VFSRRKRQSAAPDQDAVVDRALCLSAVTMLGAIAAAVRAGEMDDGEAARYLTESHRWLIREQLAPALSIRERALLAKGIADWSSSESADAVSRNEALGVLLWALSALDELPPGDVVYERLTSLVPLLAATADFRKLAGLRPPDVITSARELADGQRRYALNWLCGYAADWDSVPTDT
jgi:Domain of unknown function (DUF4272)